MYYTSVYIKRIHVIWKLRKGKPFHEKLGKIKLKSSLNQFGKTYYELQTSRIFVDLDQLWKIRNAYFLCQLLINLQKDRHYVGWFILWCRLLYWPDQYVPIAHILQFSFWFTFVNSHLLPIRELPSVSSTQFPSQGLGWPTLTVTELQRPVPKVRLNPGPMERQPCLLPFAGEDLEKNLSDF